jgi:hypothetical protein
LVTESKMLLRGLLDSAGATGAAGADRSFGWGADLGNGTVSARIAATPASHPDSISAIQTAWRVPAMSLSAFARLCHRPSGPVR